MKVGDKVLFGRTHGEQTKGTVTKVNRATVKVRQEESRGTLKSYPVGTVWTVPVNLCQPANPAAETPEASISNLPFRIKDRRSEDLIIRDILQVHSQLSPENLHCDGEISRAAAHRKEVALKARLRELEQELGRHLPDWELVQIWRSKNRISELVA